MKNTFLKRSVSGLLAVVMVLLLLPAGIFTIAAAETPSELWETEAYKTGVVLTAYHGSATDVHVPATVTVDGEVKKVVKLGDRLFADNDTLNSVTLAEGITEIGEETFSDADALVCIVTNETLTTIGDKAFYGCDQFNSIILPDSLTEIGVDAFENCPKLTVWCNEDSAAYDYAVANGISCKIINPSATPDTVVIDGVSYYVQNGEAIAIGCEADVTEVTIPATVNGYPVTELRETFKDHKAIVNVTLPDTLLKIGGYSFYMASKLETVYIPSTVTEIGEDAFAGCSKLSAVNLPEGLTTLGALAFHGCYAITSISLPSTLTTVGSHAFAYCDGLSIVTIPESMTAIPSNAFYECENLLRVVLPETVTTIGSNAFFGCTSLGSLVIPRSVTKMYDNSFSASTLLAVYADSYAYTFAVEKDLSYAVYDGISLPGTHVVDGVTYVIKNNEAIAVDCDDTLTEVTVPATVKGYPVVELRETFKDCNKVTKVTLPEGLKIIGDYAFYMANKLTSVNIPSTVTEIGNCAFAGCTKITAIDLPEGLVMMDSLAFHGCSALTEVKLPSTLTSMGSHAFAYCDGLTAITVPAGVTAIPSNAFYECENLAEVNLSEGLETIGTNAFFGCKKLTSLLIPESVTSMRVNSFAAVTVLVVYEGSYAHTFGAENRLPCSIYNGSATADTYLIDGVTYFIENGEAIAIGYSGDATEVTVPASVSGYPVTELLLTFENCDTLEKVTLPDGLKIIGKKAFYNCSNLKEVNIPTTVTKIGENAFTYCSSLPSIEFPDSVTEIETQAFFNCNSLISVQLPKNLTALGNSAFYSCHNLESVTLPANLTQISVGVFEHCSKLTTITIPETVISIGSQVFYGTGIQTVIIPESVTYLCTDSFNETTILAVYEDSYAHTFAVENDLLYMIYDGINLPTVITLDGVSYFVKNGEAIAIDCDDTLTEVTVPASVNGYPVTELLLTFENCDTLEKVTLPEGLKIIGEKAFDGCSSLKAITIPSTVTKIGQSAFIYCSSLESIVIPDNVTEIESQAFFNCSKLTSVKLSKNLTALGYSIFYSCYSLESVELPEGLKTIAYNMFAHCSKLTSINIPSTVTSIGSNAFYGTAIQTVIIPESVTYLCTDSFNETTILAVYEDSYAHNFAVENDLLYMIYDGETLPTVIKQDGVTYFIKNGEAIAIGYDGSVTEVTIPATVNGYPVTELLLTFENCDTLEKVTLPEGLKIIGEKAFDGCSSLKAITIPSTVTKIGQDAFIYCSSLESIVIPDNVTEMESSAFFNCSKLTSVKLSKNLTALGYSIFYSCYSLESVELPEGLKTIAYNMFAHCSKLTSINIPSTVTSIGSNAFYGTAIQTVIIPESVTYLCTDSFNETTILAVYEDSYAHTFAVENGLLYMIYTGTDFIEAFKVDGVTYYIIDGEAVAVSCDDDVTEVTIPATVEGYPVVELRETFKDHKSIVSVTLPEGLKLIGKYAFYMANKLTTVNVPSTVTEIADDAFAGCSKLTGVVLPEGLETLGALAFHGCYAITEIKLPESLTSMGSHAFAYCNGLTSITISGGLTSIPSNAFYSCENLENVAIPATVTSIASNAFFGCANLKTVAIPESVTSLKTNSFAASTILVVLADSYAYTFAKDNDLLYFVLQKGENPEISFGTKISGVASYVDGSATVGATVEILYDDGTVKESVLTDENGAYEFTYAEVGRYTVRVTDALGNTASETVSVKRMNAFDVFLTGDTNMTLKKAYNVSGQIENATDATVTLTDTEGNVLFTTETVDGAFAFANVSNGSYVLRAESANGSVSQEITVYNASLSNITLRVDTVSATVFGFVAVQDRDLNNSRRVWVDVTIYNADGVAVAQTKSDKDGKYQFNNLPLGEYTIVAETEEMRPDIGGDFDRNHQLTGYAYVNVTEAIAYEVEEIVLYESNEHLTEISGKVTAHGEHQACEVILQNVFHHEIATCTTNNNGKFTFKNVRDGMYFLVARTESDGMGCSVVVVRDGELFGSADITVYKSDKIQNRESIFTYDLGAVTEENVQSYKDRIAEEKRFFDGLSEKEKKQLSKSYVSRLNEMVEWLAGCDYNVGDGVVMEQGGLAVSGDELASDAEISFTLSVTKQDDWNANENGVKNGKDFVHHKMKDTAGKREIKQYYEISLTKTVDGVDHVITDVMKNTDATGTFRITMEIPEELRGYKNYSVLHVHNGETVLLTDLDDNPDTVTFEVNKFSTFALTATNEVLSETPEDEFVDTPHEHSGAWTNYNHLQHTRTCAECGETEYADHSFDASGTCTECGVARLKFSGATLTMEDNISINYKMKPEQLDGTGYSNPYVVFTFCGSTVTVKDYTVDGNGRYSFKFSDIAPRMMNDVLTATLYATYEGEVVACQTRSYSVKEYCYNMLSKCGVGGVYENNAEFKTLLVDLLNYGAAAQVYANYRTETLVIADLTAEQKSWATADAPALSTVQSTKYHVIENPTVTWKGGGLLLEDSVTMRFRITSTGAIENLKVKITTDANPEGWTISASEFVVADVGGYYIYFDGLMARQMRETVYVAVYDGSVAVSNTMTYSIESYAYSKRNDSNAALTDLLVAMMKYGDSAYNYAN